MGLKKVVKSNGAESLRKSDKGESLSKKKILPRKSSGVKKPLSAITRITVKYDVGFSNTLYLRGKGANLSWKKGIPLKNIKADEWLWETVEPFSWAEFKVLINDVIYEQGENRHLSCGAEVCYSPEFP